MNKSAVIFLAFVLVAMSSAQYYYANVLYAKKGNDWGHKAKYRHYDEDHEVQPYDQWNHGYRRDSGYGHEPKAKYKHYRYDYAEAEPQDYYHAPQPYQPSPSYGWSG